jgi:hypothetical protein
MSINMKTIQLTLLFSLSILWANATVLLVTNHNDSGAGSLRNANDISAPFDTIRFSPSLVSAGNDTIKLLSQITINNKLVFIGLRSPNNTLYISGQNTVRIFTVIGTGSTFDSLALINGRATVGGAIYAVSTGAMIQVKNCILQNNTATQRGGAIHFYNGDLQIINSDVSYNTATTEGGAVYYQIGQALLISGSSFTYNTCIGKGGAISMVGGNTSTFDVLSSTLNSNSSNTDGAAIFYEGRYFTMDSSVVKFNSAGGTIRGIIHFELRTSIVNVSSSFSNSTIAENTGTGIASFITLNLSTSVSTSMDVSYCTINSNSQGGIFSEANTDDDNAVSTVTVTHSTIANNGNLSTGYGGVYSNAYVLTGSWNVSSSVTVTNSTIVYNQSQNPGSGILSKGRLAAFSYLGVKSSIVAQNSGVNLISYSPASPITSLGYNVFSDASIVGSSGNDQLGISAPSMNLRALGNYGGPTATMMPNGSSVAVNLGTPTDFSAAQNGAVNGGRRDAGAAEYVFCATTPTTITESACSSYTLNGQTYTTSGVYTQTLINAAGCDSVITLNLTITPNDNSQFTWAGRMGTTNTDNGASVTTDKQGNVYSIGNFEGLIDLDPGAAAANFNSGTVPAFYISKLDADGNYVWGGMIKSNVTVYAYGIKVDTAGNMYITGQFYGSCDFNPGGGVFNLLSGAPDIFILKLSTTGAFVWAKALPYVTGNFSSNESNGIAIDDAGNIYTTGGYGATTDFDPNAGTYNLTSSGYQDIFVSKLDASGNFVWAKSMGNPTSGDVGNDITVDAAGNVYVTGHFQGTADFDPSAAVSNLTSAGSLDVYVVKLNSSGNLVWAKALGGTNADIAWGIQCDAAGNVYTTGNFQGTADFNPGAGSITLTSAGVNDIFISKLDASGNYVWSRRMGSTLADFSTEIKLDAAGNIYTTGSFQGTVDFNPDAGLNNLTSAGGADIFLSKLDTDGVYIWAKKIGGTGDDMGYGLNISSTGSLYVTGGFSNTVDFDPNAATFNMVSAGGKDAFIMKLGSCCVPTTATINPNVCGSYTSPSGQHVWITAGVYADTLTNSVGCDSIITINLTVRQKTAGTINQSICQGQSYFFNGANRTVQGAYLDTLINAAGCDSILTLNLTVRQNTTGTISQSICQGQSYFFNGANRTVQGAYLDTLVNSAGCDSILTLNLTVRQNTTGTMNQSICQGQSYFFNGVTRTVQGAYLDTLTNAAGCDSVLTLNLTVNQLPSANISPATVTICNGASATLTASGGISYVWSNSLGNNAIVNVSPTTSTTYTVTVTDANTCSATATRLVTVNALPNAAINGPLTICSGLSATLTASGGDTYSWNNGLGNGAVQTVTPASTTTYVVTVTNSNNCSATASQTVSVTNSPSASISGVSQICNGNSTTLTANGGNTYVWANSMGTNSSITVSPAITTTYTVTVTVGANCSATASLVVTVNQPSASQFSQTICSGSSYMFNGIARTISGSYLDTLQTVNGCDSIVTLNLFVSAQLTGSFNQTICAGTSFNFNNQNLSANGSYNDTLQTANGCDSVVTLHLTVATILAGSISETICSGSSFAFNGQLLTQSGAYTDTIQNGNGCDSIVTLQLSVSAVLQTAFTDSICSSESYLFNGTFLSAAGEYSDTLQTFGGCDSISTLTLVVNELPLPTITKSVDTLTTQTFSAYQWLKNDSVINGATAQTLTLTSTGHYSVIVTDANGCSDTSDVWNVTSVEVKDVLAGFGMKLYPNPNSGEFILEFQDAAIRTMEITDALGRIIQSSVQAEKRNQIMLNNIAAGVYLLNVKQSGHSKTMKFTLIR